MIVVVADTSPLNYLIQIEHEDLLRRLYAHLLIPQAVYAELQHPAAPANVKRWAAPLPAWVTVQQAPVPHNDRLSHLDEGERQAILLAESSHANLLVIDERRGTLAARLRGLETVGTLGILDRAHKRGWIDARHAYDRLVEKTSFRETHVLRERFLASLDT